MKKIAIVSLALLSTTFGSFDVPKLPPLKELECLATNVYREARGEPMEGQIAVAKVTMNRLNDSRYPDSICGVVYQKNQFSWTKKYKNVVYNFTALSASVVAYNSEDDFNAKYYHNQKVKPSWRKRLKEGVTIGNHTFYADI